MDFLLDNGSLIMTVLGSITTFIVAITALFRVVKSERRTTNRLNLRDKEVIERLNTADTNVKITREGIVQAFKDAVVTKDLKVSINKQVERILDDKLNEFFRTLQKSESQKTQMTYWAVRILEHTAAADKLTTEQKAELYELLALIADDEQIIDTLD